MREEQAEAQVNALKEADKKLAQSQQKQMIEPVVESVIPSAAEEEEEAKVAK